MSDASIFTTHEGLTKQIKESLNLQKKCIDNLGLEVRYAISNWDNTRKEDYIGTINEWDYAVSSMKKALEDMKIEYTEDGVTETAYYTITRAFTCADRF